jgi:hypothetical protein
MTICSNCTKKATFNILGERAKYCATHKEPNMVDVLNKKCECNSSQPRWNFEGLKPICCVLCKKEGMIETHRKKCFCGKVRPTFNFEGLKAEFCNSCKSENMINVVDDRCFCKKLTSPNFNYEGLRPKYCFECKLPNMVDTRNPKCACGSRPNFNFEGLKPKFCAMCKVDGMIDLVHNMCVCGKSQPSFNYEGLVAKYCIECKLSDMVSRNKLCLCSCKKVQPTYNFEGLQPKFCIKCKEDNMIDVKHPKCKTPLCYTRPQDKYDGHCLRCYIYNFPNKPVTKNYKTKEFSVVEFLKLWFPNFTWFADKQIKDGCSSKRPDLLLDLGYQIIIVEVDENQHNKYDCSCENKRLMEISQDLGHRPIIFIRFNPDDYININNQRVRSCWSITKITGIVKIEYKKEWNNRLECLKEQIKYWTQPENKTDKTLEIIQLFYDENNENAKINETK